MLSWIRRCWNGQRTADTTSENVVYGSPSLATPWPGCDISAPSLFALSIDRHQPELAPAAQSDFDAITDAILAPIEERREIEERLRQQRQQLCGRLQCIVSQPH